MKKRKVWLLIVVIFSFLVICNEVWAESKLYKILYLNKDYVSKIMLRDENISNAIEQGDTLYLTMFVKKDIDNILIKFKKKAFFSISCNRDNKTLYLFWIILPMAW